MNNRTEEDPLAGVGGVTGAKESILRRVVDVSNDSLAFIDDLEPEEGMRDEGGVNHLRAQIRRGLAELVGELTFGIGPKVPRIEQIFATLLDHLASLQDVLHDDEGVTSFPALADHVASLYRSWNNMQQLLEMQMGLVRKQLTLVGESVEDVRFTMNSASLGPAERQIMIVRFDVPGFGADIRDQSPMSLENMLTWVYTFATEGGGRAMTEDGGFALRSRIAPAAIQLSDLIMAAVDPANMAGIPRKHLNAQVWRSLNSLAGRLDEVAWNC